MSFKRDSQIKLLFFLQWIFTLVHIMYDLPCRKNADFWPKNHHKFNKRVISLKCDMVSRKKGPGFLRMWSGFPKRGLSFLSKVHEGFGNRVKFPGNRRWPFSWISRHFHVEIPHSAGMVILTNYKIPWIKEIQKS